MLIQTSSVAFGMAGIGKNITDIISHFLSLPPYFDHGGVGGGGDLLGYAYINILLWKMNTYKFIKLLHPLSNINAIQKAIRSHEFLK